MLRNSSRRAQADGAPEAFVVGTSFRDPSKSTDVQYLMAPATSRISMQRQEVGRTIVAWQVDEP